MEVVKTVGKIANYMIANPKKKLVVKILKDEAPSSNKRKYYNTDDFQYELNIPEVDFNKLTFMPILAHESYHIKETKFYRLNIDSVMGNSGSIDLESLILNMLEDIRINKKIYKDYPKLKRKMFMLYEEMLSKRRARKNPTLVKEFVQFMQCFELHFEEYAKIPDEYRKKYIRDSFWRYISHYLDKAEEIKSTDDLIPIRDCILHCFNQKKNEAMKEFKKDIESLKDVKKQAQENIDKLKSKSAALQEIKNDSTEGTSDKLEKEFGSKSEATETQNNESKDGNGDGENEGEGESESSESKELTEANARAKVNDLLDELYKKRNQIEDFREEQEEMLLEEISKDIFDNKKFAERNADDIDSLTKRKINYAKTSGNGVLCSLSNLRKSKLLKEKNFDIRGKGINLKSILDAKSKLDKGSRHRIGRLNPRKLYQYKTNPNIFLSRKVDKSVTLLSILIDESGSMQSKKTEMLEILKICFSSINRFKQQSGLKYQVIPFNDECDISKRFRDARIKLEYNPTGGTSIYKAFALADKHCRRLSGRRKLCVITDAEVSGNDIVEMERLSKHFYYTNGLIINRDDYRRHGEDLPFDTKFVRQDADNQAFRKAVKTIFLQCLLK